MMINVKYMTYEAVKFLKNDIKKHNAIHINKEMQSNPNNTNWIERLCKNKVYEDMQMTIEDFTLLQYNDVDDKRDIDTANAIILYEALHKLPRYVLSEERFWAWLNFDKCFQYAIQAMPITSKSTVGDHYLFMPGNRRGLFFGVLSRLYMWVDLTIDETLEDKYELTKFAISNIERIRTLTWRANSNERHIVHGIIKAEKKLYDQYSADPTMLQQFRKAESGHKGANLYTEIAKYISYYGSVRLLDAIPEEEYIDIVYDKGKDLIEKFNNI